MKKIQFHSELNAQQFSNRVNGVTNFKKDRFEVEFSNNIVNHEEEYKERKVIKEIYVYKCYNHCYDFVEVYGNYSSLEIAELNLQNVLGILKTQKNIVYLEICKMYKLN